MVPTALVRVLLAVGLLLPVAVSVCVGVSLLLSRMGDAGGGHFVGRIALICAIVWIIDLVCLLLVVGIRTLGGPPDDASP